MKKPATRKEIDRLLRESSSFRLSNPRKATLLCKQALELAESIGDSRLQAKAHVLNATLAFDRSDFPALKSHCARAMELAPLDLVIKGDCENNLGLALWNEGKHADALERYLAALNDWQRAKLKPEEREQRQQSVFVNIANLYVETGNYEKALDGYFRALALNPEKTDPHVRATLLRSIGSVYEYLQDFERAIDYDRQSLDVVLQSKNAIGIAITRYNLGNALWLKGDYEESLRELEAAHQTAKSAGDRRIERASKVIRAAVYASLGRKAAFEACVAPCLAEIDELGIADMRLKTRVIFAKSYLNLGEPEKALPLFEEAMEMARQHNVSIAEADSLQCLSARYERIGDYKQALDCFKRAMVILESHRRENAAKQLAMFEAEKRVRTLQAEKAELERQLAKLRQELSKKKGLTQKERDDFSKEIAKLNPDFSKRLLQRAPLLTKTELQVAEMIYAKLATKQIATFLKVSPRTIETHRENLRKKLGLEKGQELATFLQTI